VHWPKDLMEKILEKVKQYPQHTFVAGKQPGVDS